MAFERPCVTTLDYFPCRYGHSKLFFRGPRRRLDGAFCAVLGGSETYGKYVRHPYPTLLEQRMNRSVVNFGYMNAGADVFLNEPAILDACNRASATVVQVLGAHNMSNRFYSVHPRRNDRFLRASHQLKSIFPDVDFTEFHFTRHMLLALQARAPEKYALIVSELKTAWTARMRLLLQKITSRTILLWIEDHHADEAPRDALGFEPVMIEQAMIDMLRPSADEVVRVRPSAHARAAGLAGMEYPELDAPVACQMPGPLIHAEIAAALEPIVARTG